jgi:hypothetical protein
MTKAPVSWLLFVAASGAVAGCSPSTDPQQAEFAVRAVEFPGAPGSGQPRFAVDAGGAPIVSWLEPDGAGRALRYARFERGVFSTPSTVVSGADLFVNWADLPSVRPIAGDLWAAHWLKLDAASPGAYHVATAVSRDAGRTFSAPVQLNDDSAAAEHGFVELFPFGGAIGAFWLDGRQLAEFSFDEPDKLLGTSLRVARLDESGTVASREIVDELVCDCCQPDVALARSGPVVAYRDRTPEEIRDIVVRRHVAEVWEPAVTVATDGWRIEGCPVNGPAIAAAGTHVAVAWFTAAGDRPRVRFARSADAAQTFAAALDLDGAGSYGQVGLLLEPDGAALVSWWRRATDGGLDLVARHVGRDDALGELRVLAHSSEAQPVDVPQIVAVDDGVLVAWTTLAGSGAVHTVVAERL